MPRRQNRFTIFDAMEAAGIFEANSANIYARDPTTNESTYKGPVQFPKMFYHPKGEMEVTVPPELVATPLGPKFVGEQRQMITKTAKDEAEEAALRAQGWHDHPAKAMRAAGKDAPAESPMDRIAELERQLAALQAQRDGFAAKALAEQRNSGQQVPGTGLDLPPEAPEE